MRTRRWLWQVSTFIELRNLVGRQCPFSLWQGLRESLRALWAPGEATSPHTTLTTHLPLLLTLLRGIREELNTYHLPLLPPTFHPAMVTLPPRPGSCVTSQKVSPLWLCTPLHPPYSLPPPDPSFPAPGPSGTRASSAKPGSSAFSLSMPFTLFHEWQLRILPRQLPSLFSLMTSTTRRVVPPSHLQTISLPLPRYSQAPWSTDHLDIPPLSFCSRGLLLNPYAYPPPPSLLKTVARRPVSLSLPFLPSSVVWLRPPYRLPTPALAFLAPTTSLPAIISSAVQPHNSLFIFRFAIFCISSTSGIFPWVSHWAPSPMLLGSSLHSSNHLAHEAQESFHLLAFCLPPAPHILPFCHSAVVWSFVTEIRSWHDLQLSCPSFLPSSFQPHLNQTCLPELALMHAWRKNPSSLGWSYWKSTTLDLKWTSGGHTGFCW